MLSAVLLLGPAPSPLLVTKPKSRVIFATEASIIPSPPTGRRIALPQSMTWYATGNPSTPTSPPYYLRDCCSEPVSSDFYRTGKKWMLDKKYTGMFRLGRKRGLFIAAIGTSFFSFLVTFFGHYSVWLYAILRLFSGAFAHGG